MVRQLAGQPEDAAFMAAEGPDRFTIRGSAEFSPDGASVAWMEDRTGGDGGIFLMIADVDSGDVREHPVDLPPPCCVPHPWPLYWGPSGIWLYGTLVGDTIENSQAALIHLSETGKVLQEIPLESEPTTLITAQDGEVARVVLVYSGTNPPRLLLFLPESGEIVGITPGTQGYLQLYNPLDPEGVSVIAVPDDDQIAWVVMDGLSPQLDDTGEPHVYYTRGLLSGSQQFAPGPQGQLLMWQGMMLYLEDGAYLNPEALAGPVRDDHAQVYWGPRAWRIARPRDPIALTHTLPDATTCPGALPSRLQVLERGLVIDSVANNVRDTPSTSGVLLGQIPPGEAFDVMQGPECAEGQAWGYVNYQGVMGGRVEGDSDAYWLDPLR